MFAHKSRWFSAAALLGAATLALTACSSGGTGGSGGSSSGGGASGGSLTMGTTDKVTKLDPAGAYDNGSFFVMNQIFPFLMNSKPGNAEVEPDIAASAEFTTPTEYTVKLKPGLKWANGTPLDSADVKFTFDRQVKIADPSGPSSLLSNLDSVSAPDATTVVFKLKNGNDQTFPQVLSSPVGPIVDDSVFSADAVTTDDEIIKGKSFASQYTISSYKFNELIQFKANPDYQGLLGAPKTATVNVKYYSDSNNLKLDIQQGNIDVASRSLTATDVEDLAKNDKVTVHKGPGGELRYIVFNFDTMPFGAKTPDADPAKSLAVRQAVADSVDRAAIAKQVYKDTYTPAYSYIPAGIPGANEALKGLYGDGNGGPSKDKAASTLQTAGVTTPVTLNLQYNPDHYGSSSGDEYAQVKAQLEATGLFKVNLQSTEWVQYSKDRVADKYPAYQLGWFPDYSDSDNYLTPFFTKENFLANHFDDKEVQDLIAKQQTTPDATERLKVIGEIQDKVAAQLSTIPLLSGNQLAVAGKSVQGVDLAQDPSFKFRLGVLSK